jgi:hypothetical protein
MSMSSPVGKDRVDGRRCSQLHTAAGSLHTALDTSALSGIDAA